MKTYKILVLAFVLTTSTVFASELTCTEGQKVESVIVIPAVIAEPAITHTIHHEAVTGEITVIDTPAIPEHYSYVYRGFHRGDFVKVGDEYIFVGHNNGFYDRLVVPAVPAVTHQETIIITPAYDEVIIDVPEVIAVPAVYEDRCVTDESYRPRKSKEHSVQAVSGNASSRRRYFNLTGIIVTDPVEIAKLPEKIEQILKDWKKSLGQE